MSSTPADCIAEKALPEALNSIHDPEVLDLIRDLHGRVRRPLLLVTGPSGVGKSTLVEHGLKNRMARLNRNFRSGCIEVKVDDTSSTLANQCIREIWRQHPDLNRHIVTRATIARRQRATLLELAQTDPVKAGKQLFTILRGLEKGVTDKLSDVRFMLHIDGMERLYENCVSSGGDPFVPVFGPTADPFGFIREILDLKSIQIVLSYRDWVRESIRQALVRSEISARSTLRYAMDWPTKLQITSAIQRTILESKFGADSHHASEIAAKLIREFSKASPACVQHLNGMLATVGASAGVDAGNEMTGYLSSRVENYYQSLDDSVRGGVARMVQRISKSGGKLPAREVSNDPHLWNIANGMVDGGILCLSGRSLHTAEFSLISNDIFKLWDRAAEWTLTKDAEEAPAKMVQQADQFENHALSWESIGRKSDLLLNVDTSILRARQLLDAHRETPILSPLAFEFLQASVKAANAKNDKKMAALKMIAMIALALGVGVVSAIGIANYTKNRAENAPVKAPIVDSGLASAPATVSIPPTATVQEVEIASPSIPEVIPKQVEPEIVSPAVPAAPALLAPPAGLSADASVELIVDKIESDLSERNLEGALASVRFLHDQAMMHSSSRPKSTQLQRLTVALGKIALLQGDQVGAQFGWQMGLGGSKREDLALPDELRLLMARVEANANRNDDAAVMLFGAEHASTLSEAVEPILDLALDKATPQNLPKLDTALIARLPVSSKAKSILLGL